MTKSWKWIKRFAVLTLAGGILMLADVQLRFIAKLYAKPEEAKLSPVAIILGASVKRNGEPSEALRDRLLVGLKLYEQGTVKKILITGDDGKYHVNEIDPMRKFLLEKGVPMQDIIEDGQGYRTYESCKRATEVYGIKEGIVVTQRFHIGRALYLCNRLGMDAYGINSDLTKYSDIVFFTLRDIAASLQAWSDINIFKPKAPI